MKKIDELKKKRKELWEELHKIGDEITQLEIEGYDYTGKYIYMPEHGYMFVTWQKFDTSHNLYSDDRMFFQGYSFTGDITDYRDDYYISADAMQEWWISINDFKDYVGITKNPISDKKLKVITLEEFIKAHDDMLCKYIADWHNMLEFCEKEEITKNE